MTREHDLIRRLADALHTELQACEEGWGAENRGWHDEVRALIQEARNAVR